MVSKHAISCPVPMHLSERGQVVDGKVPVQQIDCEALGVHVLFLFQAEGCPLPCTCRMSKRCLLLHLQVYPAEYGGSSQLTRTSGTLHL